MMTRRLYYDDSFLRECEARVIGIIDVEGSPGVILDQTIFYPEGGGQPADHGWINGVAVSHTLARESDHAVVHVVEATIDTDRVICQLDWERRFDHMQHHTGQHIFTHSFEKIAGARTIGFHLGEEVVTIDLDILITSQEIITATEQAANAIIWADHPVIARLLDADEKDAVRMRKLPGFMATERLRVIDIPGIDLNACGGTHVSSTGQIGQIKIISVTKHKSGSRVEFLCGRRALTRFQLEHGIMARLSGTLSTGIESAEEAVDKLSLMVKGQAGEIKRVWEDYLELLAADLRRKAAAGHGLKIIHHVIDASDARYGRWLADALVNGADTVALVGVPGEKAQIMIARSINLDFPLETFMPAISAMFPSARGGGRPEMLQVGGFSASADQLRAVLEKAAELIP